MTEELSPSQAAARIGATTRSVQRWISAGRLPARRVGGRWRVASDALDAFVSGESPAATRGARGTDTEIGRVFVANRGEIANRIRRTCDRLGIVAIVPPTTRPGALDLLDIDAVIRAAVAARADAIHPGFGFLAENAEFADAVEAAGFRWIGPPSSAIRAMGDKAAARRLAAQLGVPTVAGYDGDDQTDDALTKAARRI
ncbi:MAG TPA: biotin carboxylase N-terminal domain-containing protein, partial [Candidatus Limnocylindrales bacterium]|nr:biotin carboxylase N-terminal domain-containing protein [Candidatus Limnocylindrales bacterium]